MVLRVLVVVVCLVTMPIIALLGVGPSLELVRSMRNRLLGQNDRTPLTVTEPRAWRRPSPAPPVVEAAQTTQKPPNVYAPVTPVRQASHAVEGDRFRQIQARLQQLGATYYRLETLSLADSSTPIYVFHCSLAGRRVAAFQATANDPIAAMQQVLSEVEASEPP
jgi:hypothetical protein